MTNNDNESDDDPMFGGRIRQYASENEGPFVVHIRSRSANSPLESRKLTKFIREKYKSDITMRQVNENKIRVEFSEKFSLRKTMREKMLTTFPIAKNGTESIEYTSKKKTLKLSVASNTLHLKILEKLSPSARVNSRIRNYQR